MMKRRLSIPLIALALLTTLIFVGCGAKETPPAPVIAETPPVQQASDEEHKAQESEETHEELDTAEEETHLEAEPEKVMPMVEIPSSSVLHLIPEQTLAIIYCPSLAELDNRVNMLAMDLMPTAENPEIIANILANTFGAGFESLAELEEIGLDLNQDFAIFMNALDPEKGVSATVHLTDSDAMKQVIAAESEGSPPIEYNGVTYWNASGGGGSFAIINDILVFTRTSEVCESVIDTHNGTEQPITANQDYSSFLLDISKGEAQLAAYLDFKSIAPDLSVSIKEQSESMKDGLESDPAAMAAAPFFEGIFATMIDTVTQLESLSATLIVEGTDLQLTPFLKFKSDGKIQDTLKEMVPNELTLLGELPSQSAMNGAFQGKQELMLEMSMFWLKMFSKDDPEQAEILESLVKQTKDFSAALGEEWSFSANFGDSIIPDYLIIYSLKDAQKAKTYMNEMLLKQLQSSMELVQNMIGDVPSISMYDGAHQGESIMHNGVEIKSYVFPNISDAFGEMPPEMAGLIPNEWRWYYAFTDDYLLMSVGSQDLIKMNLDHKAGIATAPSFSGEPGYDKLVSTLGLENNLFFALSPITMVKTLFPIIAKASSDPSAAAEMQMVSGMLMNLPENYSIGFSAKVQEGGIGATLLLTLGDFKQLFQMIAMMQSMGQMQ